MIYLLILTSLSVSIDSLLCGFSLNLNSKKRTMLAIFTITFTVFIMCIIANYSAIFLSNFLTEKSANLGGIILIIIGIYHLIASDKPTNERKINKPQKMRQNKGYFYEYLLIGFAVGLDGAFANLSLALMGIDRFFVPLTIAIFHGLNISLGILLYKFINIKKLEKFKYIPSLILLLLGGYKVIYFFV